MKKPAKRSNPQNWSTIHPRQLRQICHKTLILQQTHAYYPMIRLVISSLRKQLNWRKKKKISVFRIWALYNYGKKWDKDLLGMSTGRFMSLVVSKWLSRLSTLGISTTLIDKKLENFSREKKKSAQPFMKIAVCVFWRKFLELLRLRWKAISLMSSFKDSHLKIFWR